MRIKYFLPFILLFPICLIGQNAELSGKDLFKANCKACHSIDKKLLGPALEGVEERRDSTWIYNFILGSQDMIDAGDETAVSLFKQFNEVMMPDQNVSRNEITLILDYIESQKNPIADGNPIRRPPVQAVFYSNHFRFSNYLFWIPFTVSVLLAMSVLYYLTHYYDLRHGEQ